jgi:predicted nucleic acid-binding protein
VNVFVDTNVLLDVLARREPFYKDSAEVWTLAENGHITAYTSALSLPNIYYVLRKAAGAKIARQTVRLLRDVFTLAPLDEQIVNQAIDAHIADFEDAIQFFSALRAGAVVLITRNAADFPQQGIALQTPAEFLAAHFP